MIRRSIILFSLVLFLGVAYSFTVTRHRSMQLMKKNAFEMSAALPAAPSTDKARIRLKLSGPSISSALFRAELKKELCFFRGCRAQFLHNSQEPNEAEVVCEGKTAQISHFLEWMQALSTDVSQRKSNFQGPSLVAYILDAQWQEFKGDMLTGFVATDEAPSLGEAGAVTNKMEARNMAGTDESV